MRNRSYLIKHEEEIKDTSIIIPICLVVDVSMSMARYKDINNISRMERLNKGIEIFLDELRKDDVTYDSAEVAIITYSDEAHIFQDFKTLDNIGDINIKASNGNGDTPKGVNLALDLLAKEKEFLGSKDRKVRKQVYKPWIVIFSDGRATEKKEYDDQNNGITIEERLKATQERLNDMESQENIVVIPTLISEKKDGQFYKALSQMEGFSVDQKVAIFEDDSDNVSFKEFFKILGQSVSAGTTNKLFGDYRSINKKNKNEEADKVKDDIIADLFSSTSDQEEELFELDSTKEYAFVEKDEISNILKANKDNHRQSLLEKVEAIEKGSPISQFSKINQFQESEEVDNNDFGEKIVKNLKEVSTSEENNIENENTNAQKQKHFRSLISIINKMETIAETRESEEAVLEDTNSSKSIIDKTKTNDETMELEYESLTTKVENDSEKEIQSVEVVSQTTPKEENEDDFWAKIDSGEFSFEDI